MGCCEQPGSITLSDELSPFAQCDSLAILRKWTSPDANMRASVPQRNAYLTAVTGYPASSAAGEEVVTARLKADAERRPCQ
jgi:hypothetical protein